MPDQPFMEEQLAFTDYSNRKSHRDLFQVLQVSFTHFLNSLLNYDMIHELDHQMNTSLT